jgi:glycosyltransferase involved in cell wall biosynthesis
VVAIGYDCIPVVSAEMVPLVEPNRFVKYLTVVKHARRVAGISVSAAQEFQGFADMLPAQGLPAPTVVECALPADVTSEPPSAGTDDVPLVLCVGSFEPRKNQLAVLYASEVLWREGRRFRLRFVGGGGSDPDFGRRVRQLQRAGRPIEVRTAISEIDLARAYRDARFSVFVSTHEGYGLPVAESLALGTPVITTNYGSTREIGRDGGTVVVDPRDDAEILAAMRRLLVDDELYDRLVIEVQKREPRTWDDYASRLWSALVVPCLEPRGGPA